MYRTNSISVFVVFFLFLSSCAKPDGVVTLKINPNEAETKVNLSELVDSIKYIKLQSDSSCLIGRAHTILIREKYIYVLDVLQDIVFVFDTSGKYVSRLDKKGKGPGEYTDLGPLFVDDQEEYVEVIAHSGRNKKLLKYVNITFQLVDEKPMPDISANSCRKVGDRCYFATQQLENIVNETPTNAGIIITRDQEIEHMLFEKKIVTDNNNFSPNIESFTENDRGELFVSLMYDNTFYKINDSVASPVLNVDFGAYGIDNSIGLKSTAEQIDYINNATGLASFPVLDLNNSNVMVFSYYVKKEKNNRMFYKSDFHQYVLLKNENKVFHTKKIVNDLTGFPEEIFLSSYYGNISHEVWHKHYLVDIVTPDQYFSRNRNTGVSQVIVNGIGQLTENDNPVIVLMKLKSGSRSQQELK